MNNLLCTWLSVELFNDTDQVDTTDTLESYRQIWKSRFITAGDFSTSLEFGNEIAEKTDNLVVYGRAFVANPDLPERLRNGWKLNLTTETRFIFMVLKAMSTIRSMLTRIRHSVIFHRQ
ncbi:hypothetical protein G6F42_010849 [Rhizopus arrhizus]|nr:hypothetical protein G6F42_010849 [Rhizopus arrhizus]